MTAQLLALKSLVILSTPLVSTQLGLGMILSPATTLFLQKLVDIVRLDRYVEMRDLLTVCLPGTLTDRLPVSKVSILLGQQAQRYGGSGWLDYDWVFNSDSRQVLIHYSCGIYDTSSCLG